MSDGPILTVVEGGNSKPRRTPKPRAKKPSPSVNKILLDVEEDIRAASGFAYAVGMMAAQIRSHVGNTSYEAFIAVADAAQQKLDNIEQAWNKALNASR